MNIYDSWMVKTKIAHRGLHDKVSPENSPSSFDKAVDKGYAIEMDLQMTIDGVVVVFHDDNLKRITGMDKDIRQCTWEEINNLKLADSQETIPTFADFLKQIDGRTPLLIEVKDHRNIGVMEQKILDQLEGYKGEFSLQSFNPFIVKWFAKNAPQYCRGQLSSDFKGNNMPVWKRFLLRNLFFIRSNHSQFVSYDIKCITRRQLKRIKKRMPILAWTIRSQDQIDVFGHCFDNVIFENFIPKD